MLSGPLPSNAAENPSDYQKIVLDNGATIVSKYVPESPLVAIQVRVLSGLSNEGKYAGTGISHFLEHLLFKGTDNKDSETIRKEIKSMGGTVNGSTGLDSAEYHITVPNENFEQALDLLVNMVMDAEFTDEDMETERNVVLNEIKLHEDNPSGKIMRLLFSQAYRQNVYKYPVIGYEETFKGLSRHDVLDYHDSVYRPEQVVLGITGGIPSEQAIFYAENILMKYPRSLSWQIYVIPEARQIDEMETVFPMDVALGYIAIGFHTTSLYSPDLYPGDVLSLLIGGGNDSRLYKLLVKEKELLYSVSSINYTPRYPGLFIITGVGDPEKLDLAREEIFNVLEELKRKSVSSGELERTKNMVISEYLHSLERIKSVNSSMTSSEMMTGDPDFYKKYVTDINNVEKDGARKFASKYLGRDNSTTVILYPRGYYEGLKSKDVRLESESGKSKKLSEEREIETELENGMRIIVKERSHLPLVSVILASPGGVRFERKYNNGISNLTASLILKGAIEEKFRLSLVLFLFK